MSLRRRIPIVVAVCSILSACGHDRADLAVALAPPVASRFVVHGNCFASWSLSFDLLVTDSSDVDVVVESLSVQVDDDRTGAPLGALTLNAAALNDLLGGREAVIPAHGTLRIPGGFSGLAGPVEAPATSGIIVVRGALTAHDENGDGVQSSFRLTGTVTVDQTPLPPSGACGVP